MTHAARWTAVAAVALLALVGRPARLAAQFVDQYFHPVAAVPDSGTYAPEVQRQIDEGYRQLSLVTDSTDDEHLEAAKEAFQKALDLNPSAVEAWNGKGIYELKKDEQWLVLLESLKKLFNRDHISMAQKAFQKTLEIDPDFAPGRFNLALAHRQARGKENYEHAIQDLEPLVRSHPEFPDAALLLAMTYRDANDLEGMKKAIESLPESSFPPATRQLLLAYALINTGQTDAGTTAYWKGLDAISTEREADLYWHDVRPIVSPETDDEYAATPVAEKPAYIRRWWKRISDQEFVTPDERLAEHYRRLDYVYRNYRIPLPERRHYSAADAYTPPWQTGFDDRGVIYLRHGPPDDTASFSGPGVEQNVSWKYDRSGGDPLVFHFMSDEDVDDYKLVRRLQDVIIQTNAKMTGQTRLNENCKLTGGTCDRYDARILATEAGEMRDLYSSRGDLDPVYDRAATALDPLILQDEEARLAQDIAIGTHTQSYVPENAGAPLVYPVYPAAFKDPDGGTSVYFYYALPANQVEVQRTSAGGASVDYRYQIEVSDTTGDEVANQEDNVRIASSRPIPQDRGTMLPGVRAVPVGPGSYEYGMKITDLNSGRYGIDQGSVSVADFSASGLSMSTVVLAAAVQPASGSSPFVRWGKLKVLPLPSRVFRRSQPVFVYYEVYGLDAGADGGARYRTTYTLESGHGDRNVVARFFSAVGELLGGGEKRGAVTYEFERTDPTAADPLQEYVSLDVSDSPAGDYRLTVRVQDEVGGGTVEYTVPLTLVD